MGDGSVCFGPFLELNETRSARSGTELYPSSPTLFVVVWTMNQTLAIRVDGLHHGE